MWIGALGTVLLLTMTLLSTLNSVHYVHAKGRGGSSLLRPIIVVNFLISLGAMGLIAYAIVTDRFELDYVAQHSNVLLPDQYKLAAVWGGHEGSMLFWLMTLSLWAVMIVWRLDAPAKYKQDVLWLMNSIFALFCWFTFLTSNPFLFAAELLPEGRDLNPMLQDIGLILHPPLLYMGYIGYSTLLAFALAALMQDPITDDWLNWSRFWSVSSWCFLSAGILVGAWWAYKELGWGGWWFWDPVENASLLPWLAGTALLHAQRVMKVGNALKIATLVLAVMTFCLSITGTFIVRSGLMTSVHAFAADPSEGVLLLFIMALLMMGSLMMVIKRTAEIQETALAALSNQWYLLILAVSLLITALVTVALGTFYPLFYGYFSSYSVSVGAPYFNAVFAPLGLIGMLFIGLAPVINRSLHSKLNARALVFLLVLSVITGTGIYYWQVEELRVWPMLYWMTATWFVATHIYAWIDGKSPSTFAVIAHLGIVIVAVSAVMNSQHSFQTNRKIEVGQDIRFEQWNIKYVESLWKRGTNYTAEQIVLDWHDAQGHHFRLVPEKRHYPVRVMNMSEPAIYRFWHGDYYVNLGEKLAPGTYSITIKYNAYIKWLWLGGGLLVSAFVYPLLIGYRGVKNESHEKT